MTQANVIKALRSADTSCVCRATQHSGKRSRDAVMEGYKPLFVLFSWCVV